MRCESKYLIAILASLYMGAAAASFADEIPEAQWRNLSDKDISPMGKIALSYYEGKWKHAESPHFVYHYTNAKESETIYINSENYYKWVKDLFGVETDTWKKKAHVFVFEDPENWAKFLHQTGENPNAEAFTSGWELYIYRNPFWLAPKKTLAHELTHVIVFRFLDGPIPLFLNEGFAEFMSYKAIATGFDGNEYNVRLLRFIPKADFIPLEKLIAVTNYPEQPNQMGTLYQESELLVRFLIINYGNENFYKLLRGTSQGKLFKKLIDEDYNMDFKTLDEKFKDFAIQKS